jgi:hypothetical protein
MSSVNSKRWTTSSLSWKAAAEAVDAEEAVINGT